MLERPVAIASLLVVVCWTTTAGATAAPSRTAESLLRSSANEVVAARLAQLGLSRAEVDARLALLSSEDVARLHANLEQLQTAGSNRTIRWVVVGVVAVVVIIWLIDQAGSPYAW
jgi:uncharacterized membrane protein